MFEILQARLQQGHRTINYPAVQPAMPPLFRGLPIVDGAKCASGCQECSRACPTEAIDLGAAQGKGPRLDLGRCVFCAECSTACPSGALRFTAEFRLATRRREDLLVGREEYRLAEALDRESRALFGRSLKLRQVSAGGCNGCEGEINALSTIVFDMGRFGIQVVASPRHADGLLVTGPVTANMRLALRKTYDAVPDPKIVVAVGACAISGGVFRTHAEVSGGTDALLPVDLYVPGCPPHPLTILDGLLRLLGRIEQGRRPASRAANPAH